MTAAAQPAGASLLREVEPLVRAVLARKSGMSLSDHDERPANQEALELFHNVIARLWQVLVAQASDGLNAPAAIADFRAFAARAAYNEWNDHLRERYPRRTSLANRLRRRLEQNQQFATWQDRQEDTVCGLRAWLVAGTASASAERVSALRNRATRIPGAGTLNLDRSKPQQWDELLAKVFQQAGGPLGVDELVAIVCAAIELQEAATESIDDERAGLGMLREQLEDEGQLNPEDLAMLRAELRRFWQVVQQLADNHRRAYVLNPPSAVSGERGQIEVLVEHDVVTPIALIGSLRLEIEQFRQLWARLELPAEHRAALPQLRSLDHHCALLYLNLPLADEHTAALLALLPQQVVNLRVAAVRQIARRLEAP